MVNDVLVEKLIAAEALYGEAGVAERLGMKVRMYQHIKARRFRLSRRALSNIVRSFPALAGDVVLYLSTEAEGVAA